MRANDHVCRLAVLAFVTVAVPSTTSAQQLETSAAIAAARSGGVVIACRHGITDQRQDENETTLRYDDPTTQRRLTVEGERHASAVGDALRSLGVRATEIIASPMERAWRSAELMFGPATRDSTWHTRGNQPSDAQLAGRRRALSTPISSGNRVIVSHVVTLRSVLETRGSLEEGDCVVARPTGDSHEIIGQVPWRNWIDAAAASRR